MSVGNDLTTPRARAYPLSVHYDPDAFGRFSEAIARFLGSGRYLFGQTVFVVLWLLINVTAATLRWDPYPFVLLNLAFSLQAVYAAPLILLAQDRQDDRDRALVERDVEQTARLQADADYLARELVAIRIALERLGDHAERDRAGT